jgi:hypothetical protein
MTDELKRPCKVVLPLSLSTGSEESHKCYQLLVGQSVSCPRIDSSTSQAEAERGSIQSSVDSYVQL